MATKIKQGDSYKLPLKLTIGGELIAIQDIQTVEVYVGNIRKTYPGDVEYNAGDQMFYIPLTQDETFSLEANSGVSVDVRVKFTGGDVIGVYRMATLAVYDATSEVVL